jgi:hypothetical protein
VLQQRVFPVGALGPGEVSLATGGARGHVMSYDPTMRFRVASGEVTYRREGAYRDLTVVDNPWLRQQRDRGQISWADEADAEAAQLRATPYPVRVGELEFSTSQALVRWPYVVWDVNAYYSTLKVRPSASNREIREAYFRQKGHNSVRLTYIVKQLLDPQVRRAYDSCRPGSTFFDRYVAEYVKHKAMEDHRREFGRSLSMEEQAEEGLDTLDLTQFANQEIDLEGRHSPVIGSVWKWGYYLWKTSSYDIDKLAAWQQALCVAFSDSPRRFAVGLMAGDRQAQVVQVGYHSVAFINVNVDPTPILARTIFSDD